MDCIICRESDVATGHELTPKHIRNKILVDYKENKKHFAENKKGISVSCDAFSFGKECKTTNSQEGLTKVSVKPNDEMTFSFKVSNDLHHDTILVVGVQMAVTGLQFTMNNHGMIFGENPFLLQPRQKVPVDIIVSFTSPDIGQYEMPVMFFFRNEHKNENFVIVREIVVYVESHKTNHEVEASPFTRKNVTADNVYFSNYKPKSKCPRDVFKIPPILKRVFSNGLKLAKTATPEDHAVVAEIKDILEIGVTKDNYVRFYHHLLWYEETIARISLKKYNMSNVPLRIDCNSYVLEVPGLAEKRPSLMLGDKVYVKPHNNEESIFEGTIVKVEQNFAFIDGFDPVFGDYYRPSATFDVRFLMSRVPLERMHCAIDNVLKSDQLRRVFPRANKRPVRVEPICNFLNPVIGLNPEQRMAVEHIVAGSSGSAPYVLHGPPGTGKTVTIVEAILQLVLKDPGYRILVCTDSNMAADHVACMLAEYKSHVRFQLHMNFLLRANSRFRTWETMPEMLHTFSNGSSYINFQNVTRNKMAEYHIVVTTLSHSAKFSGKSACHPITHLFIDEAAQSSEPSCMIPICGLLGPKGRVILAGDPLQLGPVVLSHDAKRRGLGLSLMERLQISEDLYSDARSDANYTVMLRNNFRSDADILHIPNVMFYKGSLRAYANYDPLSAIDILGDGLPSRAIMFHGVRSKEEKMGRSPSFFNTMELEVVKFYVLQLVTGLRVRPEDIGIIGPYIRQVYKIKTWLEDNKFGNRIEVGTVESFQGKEKRVIIVSTVRANCDLLDHDAKFRLGFLVDDKRFNVALTRAKAKAIVIGNPLCLEKDIKWRTYMQRCRELGTYRGFDAEVERSESVASELVDRLKPLSLYFTDDSAKRQAILKRHPSKTHTRV